MTTPPLPTLLVALLAAAGAAGAQDSTARPIQDNSFLLEEAYNQEKGVVQHINGVSLEDDRVWAWTFTQEWPLRGQRHQLSYAIPFLSLGRVGGGTRGIGDVALNYRYQLRGMRGERVAVAPRFSLLLPTGSATKGTGAGGAAVQANLPVSAELSSSLVTHLNAGATFTPRARGARGATARTTSLNAGASLVWLATRRLNWMLEASWIGESSVDDDGGVSHGERLYLAPGVRWAYDLANGTQVVPGIAVPLGMRPGSDPSLFLYLSVEHPF